MSSSEAATLPLFVSADPQRPIAWRRGAPVLLAEFRSHVASVVAQLPERAAAMINLCDDRYRFLVAYAAALSVGHTVLLPSSRAEQVVADVETANAGSYRIDDAAIDAALEQTSTAAINTRIAADMTAMVGYTSGSTGQPKRFPKLWRTVQGSNERNAASIRAGIADKNAAVWLLATVPPQHMYGMEMSVLLPLIGDMAVHAGRPLFPADIAAALAELPRPRVLVSTPVHLRAIVASEQEFPQVDVIVSATAPLDQPLAAAVTAKLGGEMVEMFGSTETCVFASRLTAREDQWQLYEGVRLEPRSEGTLVHAPWFVEPVLLQDVVELLPGQRFVVRGRSSDMIEVAGKRASLSDITRRLLAIEGVREAAVFQPEPDAVGAIRRVAALVVAPNLTSREVLDQLAAGVDSAFLPRPLLIVDQLPRNEVGKLPRENLLRALRRE
ncbi:acyl-CoA synthetase [Steroidobacter sp. S1-65]|uniref:Acyl-CoA synthetase n=1 Tax=Steroidobacter gossypii TaxID=2805490 RepID=A0ABS1WTZ3_9GAMM|nr:AMP-binding protein [Steroidobacter gossypii]MBM0104437.1 acyl-CoA synthetase [Steroidobacter gossypii]